MVEDQVPAHRLARLDRKPGTSEIPTLRNDYQCPGSRVDREPVHHRLPGGQQPIALFQRAPGQMLAQRRRNRNQALRLVQVRPRSRFHGPKCAQGLLLFAPRQQLLGLVQLSRQANPARSPGEDEQQMAYSNRPCKTGEAQPDPFVFVLDRDPCAACSCADAAHTSSHPSDPPQAQPSLVRS